MVNKISNPPPGFDELTVEEKLDYVQSLWDRIAARPEAIAVPDWHIEVIEERTNENQASPQNGKSWDMFREELRAKLRQHKPAR